MALGRTKTVKTVVGWKRMSHNFFLWYISYSVRLGDFEQGVDQFGLAERFYTGSRPT
jgi:hypothetical protein